MDINWAKVFQWSRDQDPLFNWDLNKLPNGMSGNDFLSPKDKEEIVSQEIEKNMREIFSIFSDKIQNSMGAITDSQRDSLYWLIRRGGFQDFYSSPEAVRTLLAFGGETSCGDH